MTTCKHGMPMRMGCDDCTIADLNDRVRIAEQERDAARRALHVALVYARSRRAGGADALYQFIRKEVRAHLSTHKKLKTMQVSDRGLEERAQQRVLDFIKNWEQS